MITRYEELLLEEYLKDKENKEELKASALKRLEAGEPISYIVGIQYFYNIVLKVDARVLVPRPDTERLVEKAIELLPRGGNFIDLCTGSGCIALSVLKNRADLCAKALDISEGALDLALENASLIGVSDRVEFIKSDIMKDAAIDGLYDAVISNPPYIKSEVIKDYPSLSYEPIIALDGGSDGMMFYHRILSEYKNHLKEDGFFLFEIGYDQGTDITKAAAVHGFSTKIFKDYSGNDRVALISVC